MNSPGWVRLPPQVTSRAMGSIRQQFLLTHMVGGGEERLTKQEPSEQTEQKVFTPFSLLGTWREGASGKLLPSDSLRRSRGDRWPLQMTTVQGWTENYCIPLNCMDVLTQRADFPPQLCVDTHHGKVSALVGVDRAWDSVF